MRIGIVSRTATYWPLYLLEREGSVELVELGSTAAGVDALLAERVEVAATCPDVLIARGAPLRVAAGLVDRPPAWLMTAASVGGVAELRGRRIATTAREGSVSVFLRALLRMHGLERGDYDEVVVGPTPPQAAALERGEVDAAMLTTPFDERLARRGFRRLVHAGDALGPCAFTTLNVRAGWTEAEPEAWAGLRHGLAGAVADVRDERSRVRALAVLGEASGTDLPDAPRIVFDLRPDAAALERLVALLRADGVAVPSSAHAFLEAQPGDDPRWTAKV